MSWFAPPEIIRAEIWTRLPDSFRTPRLCDWSAANKGDAIDSFLEGPCFDGSGHLYVTDIPNGRLFRIAPDGQWTQVASYGGWPNGLALGSDGKLRIADYRRGLLMFDPRDGTVSPLLETLRSESFKGLNDLVISADGTICFTDQGQTGMHDPTGRVYRLTPDGRIDRILETGPSPNGLALDPTGRFLFVAMTRACQVWRVPLPPSGLTSKVNVFVHTPGGTSGPDGLAVTADGGVCIANPGHGCVWVTDRFGVPRFKVESPAGRTVTNVAFSPTDPHLMVATESETGSILVARLPVPGLI